MLPRSPTEELTWSDVLCEAHRAQELAETRLDEACKHLVTLRMRVKRLEQRADTVNDEKRAKMTFYTKWQQTTLLLAETKGDVGKQLAGLKQELTHAHTTLADERERHTTCQVPSQLQGDALFVTPFEPPTRTHTLQLSSLSSVGVHRRKCWPYEP